MSISDNYHPNVARVSHSLGPLEDGQTAIIIGGGPAGSSCAITLKMMGKKLGRDINVIIYEGMKFNEDCIKRVGVLSPPLKETLEEVLGVTFPCEAIQRKVAGYYLHSGDAKIKLNLGGRLSFVGHNVAIDRYLLGKAKELGVRVIPGRVKDIKFYPDGIAVESDLKGAKGATKGDVLVGAFGLDAETANLLEQATPYVTPKALFSVVTKIPADPEYLKECEDYLHVFLPTTLDDIEFGVVTPKLTDLIVNVAGPAVTEESLERFLSLPEVRELVPADVVREDEKLVSRPLPIPLEPAQNSFGDRYVTVGDTSGLVRAYKGNGINSACETGIKAAEVMLKVGISHRALKEYYTAFSHIVKDLPYGRTVRQMTILGEKYGTMPGALRVAAKDRVLLNVLTDFLSGTKTYREIVGDSGVVGLSLKFLRGATAAS
ncbi:MAG: NAD(P)/FAD-dependent oxidoreductase [Candidatus Brocadiales bacterium]|nr:NAD(P)/FAD-dependent oxidoreductase [Candidatus Bathyanammoxibius amoris]